MNKVWNVVQKIKGNFSKTNVHHLKDGQDALTSEQTISNKLSQTFKNALPHRKLPSRISKL